MTVGHYSKLAKRQDSQENARFMGIPDEVAQYAEGRRITSYFSLGKTHDEESNVDKDIWLWTTIEAGARDYDFDGFRVFTWNRRKHRYETAFIQRRVPGSYPTIVQKTAAGEASFSVCLVDEHNPNGERLRRRYTLLGSIVRFVDQSPCTKEDAAKAAAATPDQPPPPGAKPWWQKALGK